MCIYPFSPARLTFTVSVMIDPRNGNFYVILYIPSPAVTYFAYGEVGKGEISKPKNKNKINTAFFLTSNPKHDTIELLFRLGRETKAYGQSARGFLPLMTEKHD